ncbi:nuclear GTPase SLIP-GC isoform X2 [Lissotriton helveticus]
MAEDVDMNSNETPKFHLRRIGRPPSVEGAATYIHFNKVTTLIGRNQDVVDYFISCPTASCKDYISRVHARVVRNPPLDTHKIVDSSLTGIYVNDIRIEGEVNLQEGDTVTFGHPQSGSIEPGTRVRQPKSESYFLFERCLCLGAHALTLPASHSATGMSTVQWPVLTSVQVPDLQSHNLAFVKKIGFSVLSGPVWASETTNASNLTFTITTTGETAAGTSLASKSSLAALPLMNVCTSSRHESAGICSIPDISTAPETANPTETISSSESAILRSKSPEYDIVTSVAKLAYTSDKGPKLIQQSGFSQEADDDSNILPVSACEKQSPIHETNCETLPGIQRTLSNSKECCMVGQHNQVEDLVYSTQCAGQSMSIDAKHVPPMPEFVEGELHKYGSVFKVTNLVQEIKPMHKICISEDVLLQVNDANINPDANGFVQGMLPTSTHDCSVAHLETLQVEEETASPSLHGFECVRKENVCSDLAKQTPYYASVDHGPLRSAGVRMCFNESNPGDRMPKSTVETNHAADIGILAGTVNSSDKMDIHHEGSDIGKIQVFPSLTDPLPRPSTLSAAADVRDHVHITSEAPSENFEGSKVINNHACHIGHAEMFADCTKKLSPAFEEMPVYQSYPAGYKGDIAVNAKDSLHVSTVEAIVEPDGISEKLLREEIKNDEKDIPSVNEQDHCENHIRFHSVESLGSEGAPSMSAFYDASCKTETPVCQYQPPVDTFNVEESYCPGPVSEISTIGFRKSNEVMMQESMYASEHSKKVVQTQIEVDETGILPLFNRESKSDLCAQENGSLCKCLSINLSSEPKSAEHGSGDISDHSINQMADMESYPVFREHPGSNKNKTTFQSEDLPWSDSVVKSHLANKPSDLDCNLEAGDQRELGIASKQIESTTSKETSPCAPLLPEVSSGMRDLSVKHGQLLMSMHPRPTANEKEIDLLDTDSELKITHTSAFGDSVIGDRDTIMQSPLSLNSLDAMKKGAKVTDKVTVLSTGNEQAYCPPISLSKSAEKTQLTEFSTSEFSNKPLKDVCKFDVLPVNVLCPPQIQTRCPVLTDQVTVTLPENCLTAGEEKSLICDASSVELISVTSVNVEEKLKEPNNQTCRLMLSVPDSKEKIKADSTELKPEESFSENNRHIDAVQRFPLAENNDSLSPNLDATHLETCTTRKEDAHYSEAPLQEVPVEFASGTSSRAIPALGPDKNSTITDILQTNNLLSSGPMPQPATSCNRFSSSMGTIIMPFSNKREFKFNDNTEGENEMEEKNVSDAGMQVKDRENEASENEVKENEAKEVVEANEEKAKDVEAEETIVMELEASELKDTENVAKEIDAMKDHAIENASQRNSEKKDSCDHISKMLSEKPLLMPSSPQCDLCFSNTLHETDSPSIALPILVGKDVSEMNIKPSSEHLDSSVGTTQSSVQVDEGEPSHRSLELESSGKGDQAGHLKAEIERTPHIDGTKELLNEAKSNKSQLATSINRNVALFEENHEPCEKPETELVECFFNKEEHVPKCTAKKPLPVPLLLSEMHDGNIVASSIESTRQRELPLMVQDKHGEDQGDQNSLDTDSQSNAQNQDSRQRTSLESPPELRLASDKDFGDLDFVAAVKVSETTIESEVSNGGKKMVRCQMKGNDEFDKISSFGETGPEHYANMSDSGKGDQLGTQKSLSEISKSAPHAFPSAPLEVSDRATDFHLKAHDRTLLSRGNKQSQDFLPGMSPSTLQEGGDSEFVEPCSPCSGSVLDSKIEVMDSMSDMSLTFNKADVKEDCSDNRNKKRAFMEVFNPEEESCPFKKTCLSQSSSQSLHIADQNDYRAKLVGNLVREFLKYWHCTHSISAGDSQMDVRRNAAQESGLVSLLVKSFFLKPLNSSGKMEKYVTVGSLNDNEWPKGHSEIDHWKSVSVEESAVNASSVSKVERDFCTPCLNNNLSVDNKNYDVPTLPDAASLRYENEIISNKYRACNDERISKDKSCLISVRLEEVGKCPEMQMDTGSKSVSNVHIDREVENNDCGENSYSCDESLQGSSVSQCRIQGDIRDRDLPSSMPETRLLEENSLSTNVSNAFSPMETNQINVCSEKDIHSSDIHMKELLLNTSLPGCAGNDQIEGQSKEVVLGLNQTVCTSECHSSANYELDQDSISTSKTRHCLASRSQPDSVKSSWPVCLDTDDMMTSDASQTGTQDVTFSFEETSSFSVGEQCTAQEPIKQLDDSFLDQKVAVANSQKGAGKDKNSDEDLGRSCHTNLRILECLEIQVGSEASITKVASNPQQTAFEENTLNRKIALDREEKSSKVDVSSVFIQELTSACKKNDKDETLTVDKPDNASVSSTQKIQSPGNKLSVEESSPFDDDGKEHLHEENTVSENLVLNLGNAKSPSFPANTQNIVEKTIELLAVSSASSEVKNITIAHSDIQNSHLSKEIQEQPCLVFSHSEVNTTSSDQVVSSESDWSSLLSCSQTEILDPTDNSSESSFLENEVADSVEDVGIDQERTVATIGISCSEATYDSEYSNAASSPCVESVRIEIDSDEDTLNANQVSTSEDEEWSSCSSGNRLVIVEKTNKSLMLEEEMESRETNGKKQETFSEGIGTSAIQFANREPGSKSNFENEIISASLISQLSMDRDHEVGCLTAASNPSSGSQGSILSVSENEDGSSVGLEEEINSISTDSEKEESDYKEMDMVGIDNYKGATVTLVDNDVAARQYKEGNVNGNKPISLDGDKPQSAICSECSIQEITADLPVQTAVNSGRSNASEELDKASFGFSNQIPCSESIMDANNSDSDAAAVQNSLDNNVYIDHCYNLGHTKSSGSSFGSPCSLSDCSEDTDLSSLVIDEQTDSQVSDCKNQELLYEERADIGLDCLDASYPAENLRGSKYLGRCATDVLEEQNQVRCGSTDVMQHSKIQVHSGDSHASSCPALGAGDTKDHDYNEPCGNQSSASYPPFVSQDTISNLNVAKGSPNSSKVERTDSQTSKMIEASTEMGICVVVKAYSTESKATSPVRCDSDREVSAESSFKEVKNDMDDPTVKKDIACVQSINNKITNESINEKGEISNGCKSKLNDVASQNVIGLSDSVDLDESVSTSDAKCRVREVSEDIVKCSLASEELNGQLKNKSKTFSGTGVALVEFPTSKTISNTAAKESAHVESDGKDFVHKASTVVGVDVDEAIQCDILQATKYLDDSSLHLEQCKSQMEKTDGGTCRLENIEDTDDFDASNSLASDDEEILTITEPKDSCLQFTKSLDRGDTGQPFTEGAIDESGWSCSSNTYEQTPEEDCSSTKNAGQLEQRSEKTLELCGEIAETWSSRQTFQLIVSSDTSLWSEKELDSGNNEKDNFTVSQTERDHRHTDTLLPENVNHAEEEASSFICSKEKEPGPGCYGDRKEHAGVFQFEKDSSTMAFAWTALHTEGQWLPCGHHSATASPGDSRSKDEVCDGEDRDLPLQEKVCCLKGRAVPSTTHLKRKAPRDFEDSTSLLIKSQCSNLIVISSDSEDEKPVLPSPKVKPGLSTKRLKGCRILGKSGSSTSSVPHTGKKHCSSSCSGIMIVDSPESSYPPIVIDSSEEEQSVKMEFKDEHDDYGDTSGGGFGWQGHTDLHNREDVLLSQRSSNILPEERQTRETEHQAFFNKKVTSSSGCGLSSSEEHIKENVDLNPRVQDYSAPHSPIIPVLSNINSNKVSSQREPSSTQPLRVEDLMNRKLPENVLLPRMFDDDSEFSQPEMDLERVYSSDEENSAGHRDLVSKGQISLDHAEDLSLQMPLGELPKCDHISNSDTISDTPPSGSVHQLVFREWAVQRDWAFSEKDLEFELKECHAVLHEMEQVLIDVQGVEDGNKKQWRDSILSLKAQTKEPSKTYIAVVGDTGSGKSSLLNALLDEEAVLPTSGMQACTAVVVEIARSSKENKYKAEVEFLSEEEWNKELVALIKDMKDKSGNWKKRNPDRKSEAGTAFCRVKAVYGRIAELPELKQMREVTCRLGTVEYISGDTAEKFRGNIRKYIESCTDEMRYWKGGQLWPIVKCVRIYVPNAEVLKTGAVLVDLPGVRDSNAARDCIAREYLKKCHAVWVVAQIIRAVSDKTAKDLLNENLRRQLYMDGQYEGLAFICTKTDIFNKVELKRDLNLEEQLLPLESKVEALEEKIKTMQRDIKDLDDRLHTWKSESNEEKPVHFQQGVAVDLRDLIMKMEREKSAMEREKVQIFGEISLICVKSRNDFSKGRIQLDFNSGLQEMKKKSTDHEDEDEESSEEEEGFSNLDAEEMGGTPQRRLEVFTVSSTEYLKLRGKLKYEEPAKVFTKEEETEIPALKAFAIQTALRCGMVATEKVIRSVASITSHIISYLTNQKAQDETLQAQIKDVVRLCLADVRKMLQAVVKKSTGEFSECFDILLRNELMRGVEKAKGICEEKVQRWGSREAGGYPYSTYKAVCSRQGVYTSAAYGSIDFNEELSEPLVGSITLMWKEVFSDKLFCCLKSFSNAVWRRLDLFFQTLKDQLQKLNIDAERFDFIRKQQMEEWNAELRNFILDQNEYIKNRQREISRILTPDIQRSMSQAYTACDQERGPGSFNRMKGHMLGHVRHRKSTMFACAADKLMEQLCLLRDYIRASFEDVIEKLFDSLDRQLNSVLKPVKKNDDIIPDLKRIWDNINKICERSCVDFFLPEFDASAANLSTKKEGLEDEEPPSFKGRCKIVQIEKEVLPYLNTIEVSVNGIALTRYDGAQVSLLFSSVLHCEVCLPLYYLILHISAEESRSMFRLWIKDYCPAVSPKVVIVLEMPQDPTPFRTLMKFISAKQQGTAWFQEVDLLKGRNTLKMLGVYFSKEQDSTVKRESESASSSSCSSSQVLQDPAAPGYLIHTLGRKRVGDYSQPVLIKKQKSASLTPQWRSSSPTFSSAEGSSQHSYYSNSMLSPTRPSLWAPATQCPAKNENTSKEGPLKYLQPATIGASAYEVSCPNNLKKEPPSGYGTLSSAAGNLQIRSTEGILGQLRFTSFQGQNVPGVEKYDS